MKPQVFNSFSSAFPQVAAIHSSLGNKPEKFEKPDDVIVNVNGQDINTGNLDAVDDRMIVPATNTCKAPSVMGCGPFISLDLNHRRASRVALPGKTIKRVNLGRVLTKLKKGSGVKADYYKAKALYYKNPGVNMNPDTKKDAGISVAELSSLDFDF